jgi:acetyl-CoA carboxylase biotin carboxyl carrier protein
MELKEVKELLKAFDESGSSYIEIKQGELAIKIKKELNAKSISESGNKKTLIQNQVEEKQILDSKENDEAEGEKVLAPLVGVFYAAPSPEEKAYVQVGDKVKAGETLCLIEAMKMMSEITAPKDGVIKKIYVKNQDVVAFEDPLFLIGD